MKKIISSFFVLLLAAAPWAAAAVEEAGNPPVGEAGHSDFAFVFLGIAVLLVLAKVSGLVEKFGQPAVLGELVMGIILGNLVLFGFHFFDQIKTSEIMAFLAELGVVILLFQIGLESNIGEMKKVGGRSLAVAVIGVVVPFVIGTYVVGPWLLPGLSQVAYLFIGATLTATSVGITARVFKDLGKLQTSAARVVLGAAVIDDVLGLIILAVVSAIATTGAVSLGAISLITLKAFVFLAAAIFVGQWLAPIFGRIFSKINTGLGMKFSFALAFGLAMAFAAQKIGLAPIVGAFAAGLVLDAVHFKFFEKPQIIRDVNEAVKDADSALRQKIGTILDWHSHRHIEELLEPLAYFLVPLFFVLTGMNVDLSLLADGKIILTALIISLAAFIGKIVAGLAGAKGDRLLVGVGMIPRGEVGLIFANMGLALGVISNQVFAVAVIVVILSTLVTPPFLASILKRRS